MVLVIDTLGIVGMWGDCGGVCGCGCYCNIMFNNMACCWVLYNVSFIILLLMVACCGCLYKSGGIIGVGCWWNNWVFVGFLASLFKSVKKKSKS